MVLPLPYTITAPGVATVCANCYPGDSIKAVFPVLSGYKISHGICEKHKKQWLAELAKSVGKEVITMPENNPAPKEVSPTELSVILVKLPYQVAVEVVGPFPDETAADRYCSEVLEPGLPGHVFHLTTMTSPERMKADLCKHSSYDIIARNADGSERRRCTICSVEFNVDKN